MTKQSYVLATTLMGAIGILTSGCGRDNPHSRVYSDAEMVASIKSNEQEITVAGKTLRIGDTADDVFKELGRIRSVRQDTTTYSVTHIYDAEGGFALTFARKPDPGPYRLLRISTHPRDTSTSMLDCIDYSMYLEKTTDLNFFVRVEMVKNARERGECREMY